MTQSTYEKVINDIINGKNEEFEAAFDMPYKKLVISVLHMVQEVAAKEAEKQEEPEEEIIIDRFYSDIPKAEAFAIVNEILENVESTYIASKVMRMFVNNKIPVDQVKRLLDRDFETRNNLSYLRTK